MYAKRFSLAALIGVALVVSAQAAKVGDKVENLVIKDWVKGNAVDVTDGKKIYVVEFWATWCAPCKQTIPFLTEIQKKFKDKVVIVGVSDEPAATVKPFVETMADTMGYIVACDNEAQTNLRYRGDSQEAGIPFAMVVKDQKLFWYGHPMAGLETALE